MLNDIDSSGLFVKKLSVDLSTFNEDYIDRFKLDIPKGVIKTIDFYKEEFFPYLVNSDYKSNICYLLQNLDFDLWIYSVFSIKLSLEKSHFYQLKIKIGIIAEVLAAAIVLHPILKEIDANLSINKKIIGFSNSENTKSLADIPEITKLNKIKTDILENSFADNLKILSKLGILSKKVIDSYYKVKETRNLVHVQNWEGTLFDNLTVDSLVESMDLFKQLLLSIKNEVRLTHVINDILVGIDDTKNKSVVANINLDSVATVNLNKIHEGRIFSYDKEKGVGFIKNYELKENISFNLKSIIETSCSTYEGASVKFSVQRVGKNLEAFNVKVF